MAPGGALLRLRRPAPDDAGFILRLLNDPDWLRNIGDRGVRCLEDAQRYIEERLLPSFHERGQGLWVAESPDGRALGLCGLLRRPEMHAEVEIGFAFLPEARGRGLAGEAARLTLEAARAAGLSRLIALTLPDNAASVRVLQRLGMSFERRLGTDDGELVDQYAMLL
jgi:RimJ/RimL family protein N-acetyltransferase